MPIIYKPFWRQRTAKRTPRYIKGYPTRPKTLVRRFRGSTIRWDEVRILPRPRRHARVGWGTLTRLDKQAYLDSKMMPGIDGSREERIVYKALVARGLIPGADFIFQAAEFGGRAELGGLVADFLFPLVMAILQVQSVWHTMTSNLEKRDADQKALLEDLGYTVLEIWPEDIHDPLRLEDWLDRNFGKMWGTSFSPSVAGSYTALEVPGILMNITELEAQVQQLELMIGNLGSEIDHISMAIFGGGASGPQLRITSASLAGTLSSANFETGVAGWQILRSGSIEINDLTARGTLQSYNYVAGTSGWKLDQAGTAEILELTARGTVSSDNFVTTVSGWQILNTGSAEFNDILARGTVASTTFSTGVSGWQIHEDGSAEFNDITARGTMQSTTFSTGVSGWKIFAAGSAEFNDLTARGTMQSTSFSTGVSGWKIAADGSSEFNSLVARGSVESTTFSTGVSGWQIAAGGSAEFNDLTARGTVESSNFVTGIRGWHINDSGAAEFGDVKIRGAIQAAVFEVNSVSAVGGTVVVGPATRLNADITDTATTLYVDAYPGLVGEFIELRGSALQYEMMKVTGFGDGYVTVTRAEGGTSAFEWENGTVITRRGDRIVLETTEADGDIFGFTTYTTFGILVEHTTLGYKTAFSFVCPAGVTVLRSVKYFVASSAGADVCTTRISLYSDSAGSPGSSIVYTDYGRIPSTGGFAWQEYDLGASFTVTPSTTYWIVFEHLEAPDFSTTYPQFIGSDTDLGNTGSVTKVWNGSSWGTPTIGDTDCMYQLVPLIGSSRIDIYDWSGPLYSDETLKTRIGRLDGTTDPYMTPTGYGFYSSNAYLSGTGVFGSGAVTLDSDGITITEGTFVQNTISWYDADHTFYPGIIYGEMYGSWYGRLVLKADDSTGSYPFEFSVDSARHAFRFKGNNTQLMVEEVVSPPPITPDPQYRGFYPGTDGWYDIDDAGVYNQFVIKSSGAIKLTGSNGQYQAPELGSAPTTPATGYRGIYAKADGWYDIDDAGVSTQLGAGGGGGSGPLLWLGW